MWAEMLLEKKALLEEGLERELGKKTPVLIRQEENPQSPSVPSSTEPEIPQNPVVREAVEILNATVKEVKRYGHE